jgi:hypothetical protein
VLLEEVEALGLEVVGKRAVGNGVVALEGAAEGAMERRLWTVAAPLAERVRA